MDDNNISVSSALLLVVGEPQSEAHKTLILENIIKGFRSWDAEETGVNINEELAQIANRASLGEEGINGERLIQHQSENIVAEILINPLSQTVKNSLKKLLISPSENKYIIYSGYAFQGSGAWVLQDETFAFSNFAQVFKNKEVENSLKNNIEANLTIIHTLAESNWGASISKADFTSHLRIQLNPPEKLDNVHGVLQFAAYVSSFLKVVPVTSLLQSSEQFGNIGFTRPTLYIFPGCQGDSALFGINGFNLLINGGYSRRACFWDFTRHLDRVDAMLMTHLGTDNIFGLNTVLERKCLENIHPQIGYLYFNAIERVGSTGGDGDNASTPSGLIINLAEEATNMTNMARQLGIGPYPCLRSASGDTCEPINLYHKLGHGSLDMYVLNPVADSKELKEFYQAWSKQSSNLGSSGIFPLQNVLSVCALLVWKPYNLDEKIVRIFLPGNAPQHRIIEGLEKVKNLGYLKLFTCTSRDLIKPPAVKKPLGGTARPGSSRPVKSAPVARSEPMKTVKSETLKKTATSPTKVLKNVKEENNKKKVIAKEKPAEAEGKKNAEKDLKGKPAARPTSASPVKRSASPTKPTSPTKAKSTSKSPSPPKTSPIKSPTKAKPTVNTPVVSASDQFIQEDQTADQVSNHIEEKPQDTNDLVVSKGPGNPQEEILVDVSSSVDQVSPLVDKSIQQLQVNGGEHIDTEEEEVKPQALPEPPVILESPCQDSDAMQDYSLKMESDELELSDFSRAEEELLDIESRKENMSFSDPAQEIPSSPEPVHEEQPDDSYSPAKQVTGSFETPVFAHEGPDPGPQPSMEQSIQYGIYESHNARDMGGIQEVDEEEQDEDINISRPFVVDEVDREGVKVKTLPDDISDTTNKVYDSQETEDGDEDDKADNRISAERQFEDAEMDDKISNKDISSDFRKARTSDVQDKDSIDGDYNDDEKDVDESTDAQKINGALPDIISNTETNQQNSDPNTFIGIEKSSSYMAKCEEKEVADCDDEMKEESFNPEENWGPPMGLPSPIFESGGTSPQKSNGADKRQSLTARSASTRTKVEDTKKRPGTASSSGRSGPNRPTTATKRPASSRTSPVSTKTPPLPPMTPYYVDLTYIPNHGDPAYSDIEFFKRVRARYYVISALSPNTELLSSLMEAKVTWEQKDLEVTLIPTYDSESLRCWFGLHKDKLQELRIDLTPAVSRCTIQLQDLETSLPAFRLEV